MYEIYIYIHNIFTYFTYIYIIYIYIYIYIYILGANVILSCHTFRLLRLKLSIIFKIFLFNYSRVCKKYVGVPFFSSFY